jgi:hypothetical protein
VPKGSAAMSDGTVLSRQQKLAREGVSSFPFDTALLAPLETVLQEHLIGNPACLEHLRHSMGSEEDVHVETGGDEQGIGQQQWGYTKSGVTTTNMAYVWAESEAALSLFQPLADAVLAMVQETTPHELMLFAASFIIHAPPGTDEKSAIPHMDWDLALPRGSSFSVLTPLSPFNEQIGGLEYWPLPFDRYEPASVSKYEHGQAVVFDGAVQHRTQPYACAAEHFPALCGQPLRILVQMSFAVKTTGAQEKVWGDIQASLERQSTGYYRSPNGPCKRQEEASAA